MENRKFKWLLKRYIENRASDDEIKNYESFYDSFQNQEKDWEEPELNKIKKEIFQNISDTAKLNKQSKIIRFIPFLKIAASIVVLLAVGYISYHSVSNSKAGRQYVTIATNPGEKKSVVLEDGSKITLNVGSRISYYEPFKENRRGVTLEGEAFFDVAKDSARPFIINTGAITTTVLGTSFNIHAYGQENIRVTVSTGRVKVAYSAENKLNETSDILKPGEQVLFDIEKKTLMKYSIEQDYSTDWQKNIIRFNEVPFSDIINRLHRIFNVDIKCNTPGLLDKIVTSYYDDPDLIDVITDLQFMLGFEYEFINNGTDIIIE